MMIEPIGEPKVIFHSEGVHNYFAWPTVVRTKDDAIVAACSGFRLEHICPFGKAVIAVSKDDGETFTPPQVVIDTILDDRDAGLCAFGKNGLIVTSFNNSADFQKNRYKSPFGSKEYRARRSYVLSYYKRIDKKRAEEAFGSEFRISFDGGVTFGPTYKSPVTSPHGPIELLDGTILWVGRVFTENVPLDGKCLEVYTVDPLSGKMKCVGEIEDVFIDDEKIDSCEPYALQLPNGKIVCHIRVDREKKDKRVFTLYQSESSDNGKTWTTPRPILDVTGGAPAHLMLHSSGSLVCCYGYRNDPPAVKAIVSKDGGESWSEPFVVCDKIAPTWDMGYPSSVELKDGSILTVFYAHTDPNGPANILTQKWRMIL